MAAKVNGGTLAILLGVGAAALMFLGRKKKLGKGPGMLSDKPVENIKIGKFFRLHEFLGSKLFPKGLNYQPKPNEMENLKALVAKILDPFRQKFGKTVVYGGGRPPAVAAAYGTTWYDAIKKAGGYPVKNSDHIDFSAADVYPTEVKGREPWQNIIKWMRANKNIRLGIIYAKTQKNGISKITHIHFSCVLPGKPAHKNPIRFKLDGKEIPTPAAFEPTPGIPTV